MMQDGEERPTPLQRKMDELRGATNAGVCLTGAALDRMRAAQLNVRVGNVSVFARTSPRHEMAIVGAFQARGAVVGMTDDGGEYQPLFCSFVYGSDARARYSCCS